MTAASLLLTSVLAIHQSVLAQTPPVADASKLFAYDATKPLNLTIGKSEAPAARVNAWKISYASSKGGRVPGYLVVPKVPAVFGNLCQTPRGAMVSRLKPATMIAWT
jgi:cephalosporin-C deacetylase-like acetyl esterase